MSTLPRQVVYNSGFSLTRVMMHAVCLIRRPSKATFFLAGIRREFPIFRHRLPPTLTLFQENGAFKSDAVPPWGAAPSVILDGGHRVRRAAHSIFGAVGFFLSDSVDSSPFQDVSLGREISIIFSSNGPLIYKHGLWSEHVYIRNT